MGQWRMLDATQMPGVVNSAFSHWLIARSQAVLHAGDQSRNATEPDACARETSLADARPAASLARVKRRFGFFARSVGQEIPMNGGTVPMKAKPNQNPSPAHQR